MPAAFSRGSSAGNTLGLALPSSFRRINSAMLTRERNASRRRRACNSSGIKTVVRFMPSP